MKKLFFVVVACLLTFFACSDNDEVFKPEPAPEPEIDTSILGTYLIANKTKSGEITSLVLDPSYLVINENNTGELFSSKENKSENITWSYDGESYKIKIGDKEQVVSFSNQTAETIQYKEAAITNDKEEKFIFIKNSMPFPDWQSSKQDDKAIYGTIALSNNKYVAAVYAAENNDISFKLGTENLNGNIKWLDQNSLSLGKGSNPSVAINDKTYTIVGYTPEGKEGTWYRAGWVDYETSNITWDVETEYGTIPNVKFGFIPDSQNAFAIFEENGEIKIAVGIGSEVSSKQSISFTWQDPTVIGEGINPSVGISSDYTLIASYQKGDKIYYKQGVATDVKLAGLTWDDEKEIGIGQSPYIAINPRNDLILSYNLPNLPIQVYRTGTLQKDNISINNPNFFDNGVSQGVSLTSLGRVTDLRTVKGVSSILTSKVFKYQTAWMDKLNGELPISDFSIPGTHDSSAKYGGAWYQCQNWNIIEQLHAGIRFYDIRCKYDNGKLGLFHGGMHQRITLDQLLDECFTFLNANPSETIIMSIRNENDGASAEERTNFQNEIYARLDKNKNRWFTENRIPTLNESRNKIVLFRRFVDKIDDERGIDASIGWKDKKTFTIKDMLRVQDEYGLNATQKWTAVEQILEESSTTSNAWLYVNFLSSTGGFIPNPRKVAASVNLQFEEYLDSHSGQKRYGCVLYDFPNYSSVEKLIKSNFK